MRKLRTIIVDDEQAGIDTIATFIKDLEKIELVKTFTDPLKALDALNGIDLIFLDMEMPKIKGYDFMKMMNSRAKVIVVTAYPEYAVQGYDHDIVDFVVKPAEEVRVIKAVHKAYQIIYPSITNTMSQLVEKSIEKMIKVRADGSDIFLKCSIITYVEASGNYIEISTKTDKHVVLETLGGFYERLPAEQFARIHRSFIVNLAHVIQVDRDNVYVDIDKNVKLIPLSENYRKEFWRKVEGE